MKKLNFRQFVMPTGVRRAKHCTVDAREGFADMIYNNVNGIRAHALALKIYQSDGEEEYSKEDCDLMVAVAERYALPGFIDGLRDQINNQSDPQ